MADAWMANGVQLAWLIDPRSQKAWIYRAGAPVEEVPDFETTLSGEPLLPGFELDLRELK
jgi:Uma2 family endonuclease